MEFQILPLTVTHRGGVLSKICVSAGLVTQIGGGGSSAINVKSHTNPIKFSSIMFITLHLKGLSEGYKLGVAQDDGSWDVHEPNLDFIETILNGIFRQSCGLPAGWWEMDAGVFIVIG